MANVTYLFGAGASAQCLPVVTQIPERMKSFYQFVHDNRTGTDDKVGYGDATLKKMEDDFMAACQELIDKVAVHQSIDTYAKKLRLLIPRTGHAELRYLRLKIILSCFFIFEQLSRPADSRYDAFFASILGDSDTDFPENLRILSWNYDFQFEKAYTEYFADRPILANIQNALRIYPSTLDHDEYQKAFGIFKLNGTTGFYDKSRNTNLHLTNDFEISDPKALVKEFVMAYCHCILSPNKYLFPLLSFAWERSMGRTKNIVDVAAQAVKATEVLVIIGYSIPFFNRKVDKEILNNITYLKTIRGLKVYIQDVNPESVKSKLNGIFPDDKKVQVEVLAPIDPNKPDQFFLPPEL